MRDPAGGLVPPTTLFGAAVTAAAEGGLNGPGEPANQWSIWERTGRATAPGVAGDVWRRPEQALDRAATAGCEVLALPVEWSRVEPSPGQVDGEALERYARIVGMCADRGMVPMATLHELAHPQWLGDEYWLTPGSPDRFADHVVRVVRELGPACRHWLTFQRPNLGALAGWVGGHDPPGRVGAVSDAWAVLDNLLTAHVLAYDAIHELQSDPVVAMGMVAPGSYDWHRLPVDLLLAPRRGVERPAVDAWIDGCRRHHTIAVAPPDLVALAAHRVAALLSPYGVRDSPSGVRDRLRAQRAAASPRRVLDAVYARPGRTPLDALVLVWAPGHETRSSRPALLGQLARLVGVVPSAAAHPAGPWDAPVDLDGLAAWCRALRESAPDVPLWIQAGLAMPPDGAARSDGWDRPSYLRAAISAVVDAVDGGAPMGGLLYCDLGGATGRAGAGADHGLFAVEPEPDGTGARWQDVDGTGAAAGEAFRRFIAAVRAGDRSALALGQPAAPVDPLGPEIPGTAVPAPPAG